VVLAGSCILITRPEQQGDNLIKKLTVQGAKAIHYPVLEIAPLSPDDTARETAKHLILDLDLYQHVIFISTNAVYYGTDYMEQYWPQWPVGIAWHAIGVATAKAMMERGIHATAPSLAMNSEALLQIMDLQHIPGQKVLIVRGAGGREYLAEQLRAKGATVDYVECYQRRCPLKTAGELAAIIESQKINTICINSGESLDNLMVLAGEDMLAVLRTDVSLVLPGERVAELARQEGFTKIKIAENASDDAMLAAMMAQ
jgi:uroporphyrinogen-III synthase